MEINKTMNSEYHIGILWNMGRQYSKEILINISNMYDIVQVNVYDLKNNYDSFILDCYKGDNKAYKNGYIYEKIKNMEIEKNKQIVVFVVKIDNPTYIDSKDYNLQCVETRKIKTTIRELYSPKIKGYFFDNLIHISDNLDEKLKIQKILKTYSTYLKFIYIKKDCEPVVQIEFSNEKNLILKREFLELLNELKIYSSV